MGFNIDKYSTKINIDLGVGAYLFSAESATGKTRLYKTLKDMQTWGEPVISYSYSDYKYGMDLNYLIKRNEKAKVVMIDRYDMFDGAYQHEISELAKNKIVMIDCKNTIKFTDNDQLCFIEMTNNSITVEE